MKKTKSLSIEVEPELEKVFKEFARDYGENLGIAFKVVWDNFLEYQYMKEKLLDLSSIESRLTILEQNVKSTEEAKTIKTLGGRQILKR